MAATLVSNNTTIKINGTVQATASAGNNLFSTSANSYCLFNIAGTATAAGAAITIGGVTAYFASGATTYNIQGLVSGPGQVVAVGGAGGTATASGVEFTNTP